MKLFKGNKNLGESRLTLRLWHFTGSAILNLVIFILLTAYLAPLPYMFVTSLKSPEQVSAGVMAPLYPATYLKYAYQGVEYPIMEVPTVNGIQQWALVNKYRTYSEFIDPQNPGGGLIHWNGNWRILKKAYVFSLTFSAFKSWQQANLPLGLLNTLIVVGITEIGVLATSIAVAYGFSRFRIPGGKWLFFLLIATILIPDSITLLPTYVTYLNLLNNWLPHLPFLKFLPIPWNWLPLIAPHFFSSAIFVFLLRQNFLSIPHDLDEAAMLDGAGPLRILVQIILPQSIPVVTTVAMLHFFYIWNEFRLSSLYLGANTDLWLLAPRLQYGALTPGLNVEPAVQASALILMIVPALVLLALQRFFMNDMVVTGLEKQSMNKRIFHNIVLLWLAWVLIVIGFQALTGARFQPQWPDQLIWFEGDPTDPTEVINYRQVGHPYMNEPFMNNQVSWDSENYIGISIGGYDDPCITVAYESVYALGGMIVPCMDTVNRGNEKPIRLSYAFFPFYPILMHLFSIPLSLLQLNPIATATLAGVIISALGLLAAMLALYDLTHEKLGEDGAMRAVFYLLIFPASFFFVQVYSEGLFVGLAFGCLAMLKRKHLVLAALLAGAATLTRAVGIMLLIPMAITWIHTHEWYELDLEWDQLYFKRPPWRPIFHALLAFTPLIVYLIWKFSYYGAMFDYVQTLYFFRAPLDLAKGFSSWALTLHAVVIGHAPGRPDLLPPGGFGAHYSIELVCSAIGFITILRGLKTDPEVAWFSLAAFLTAWVSGPPGIHRYMLAAPALFITLARWGKNPVFDRVWTLSSLLLMGFLAMLYAFNFWVA